MFIWIGRNAPSSLTMAVFGRESLASVEASGLQFAPIESNPLVGEIRKTIRSYQENAGTFQQLHVLKQGDPLERRFSQLLVEDGQDDNSNNLSIYHKLSYVAFLCNVHRQITAKMQQ